MMTELLIPFAGFAFVSSITPGPNNLMLMASGANYGFRRTVPHMLGIGFGFSLMVLLVGVGLIGVFEAFPLAHAVLKAACVVYLLWLAWKIATAAAPGEAQGGGRPMTFVGAALFQWVNPKAWAMALTAVTLYAPDRSFGTILVIAAIFGAINLPSVSLWTVLGQGVRRFLANRRRLRAFNGAMAVLLILSVVPMF
jgi:threonine/homoserine/homoserine lactone efflux protein